MNMMMWAVGRKWTPEDGDRLFNEDGSVRLPRLTAMAISAAVAALEDGRPNKALLTRQSSHDRAEQVRAALATRVAERGFAMEIRPSASGESFGLYLTLPRHADEPVAC